MSNVDRKRTLAKWRRYDKEVGNEIWWLYHRANVYNEVRQIVKRNASIDKPNLLWDWMCTSHAAAMAMTVRRLMDRDAKCKSLATLIYSVCDYPALIERSAFAIRPASSGGLKQCLEEEQEAHAAFTRYALSKGEHLDPRRLERALSRTRKRCLPVIRVADRALAHHQCVPSPMEFEDLDIAMESIGALFHDIHLLLTRHSRKVGPSLPEDWKWVFDKPWHIKEGETNA